MTDNICIDMNNIQTEFRNPVVNSLWEMFRRYNIKISTAGGFVDGETFKMLRPNHIRCMLRRECIEAGCTLKGKALEKFIDRFLVAISKAAVVSLSSHPEYFTNTGSVKIGSEFL